MKPSSFGIALLTVAVCGLSPRLVVAQNVLFAKPTLQIAQSFDDFSSSNSTNSSEGGATAVNYTVPGIIEAIAQPSGMTCWATVATMMVSWHEQQSFSIESVMDKAGQDYRNKFDNNQGLSGSEKPQFIAALGMREEAPQSYSVQGLATLIQNNGLIWVTTDEPGIHARIIAGISGDGTPDGTQLKIVDPDGGSIYTESFSQFAKKYEDVAYQDMANGGNLRIQIVHF